MKRIVIMMAIAIFCLASCTGVNEKQARKTAESFLTSYYAMDYEAAKALCTEDYAEAIDKSFLSKKMPESLKDLAKESAAKTSFEIVSVDMSSEEEIVVKYNLSTQYSTEPFERELILKVEGKSALVNAIK